MDTNSGFYNVFTLTIHVPGNHGKLGLNGFQFFTFQVGEQDEVVREQEEVIGDSVEAMLEGEGGGVSREVSVKEHGQVS